MTPDIVNQSYDEVIRSMIASETSFKHNRMNWLLLSQSLLITAFCTICEIADVSVLLYVLICLVGIAICFATRVSFRLSEAAIAFILSQWDEYILTNNFTVNDFPPVWAGSKKELIPRLINQRKITNKFVNAVRKLGYRVFDLYKSMPVIFTIMWFILMVISVL